MGFLLTCIAMYHIYIPGAHGGQKRVPYPLDWELQMVVIYYVGAGHMLASSPDVFPLLHSRDRQFRAGIESRSSARTKCS